MAGQGGDVEYAENGAPSGVALAADGQAAGDLPFVEAVAQEVQRMLATDDEVDEQFLRDAGISREELITFAKKYEKIERPGHDQDVETQDGEEEASAAEGTHAPDDERGVVIGSGVDEKAQGMGDHQLEEGSRESIEDLFDEFSDNISPEYRDLIKAYYKRLAAEEAPPK